jgi:magnesium chelatase subunit D
VAVITFSGDDARIILPPTRSVHVAARCLAELPVGGKTPLAAALQRADELVTSQRVKNPHRRPLLVLMTDGRANVGRPNPIASALNAAHRLGRHDVAAIVVTTDRVPLGLSVSERVATALGAPIVPLDEMDAGSLARVVLNARRVA